MKVICDKASECSNCCHSDEHEHNAECDQDSTASDPKFCIKGARCIPVECEWRVRQSEATGKNWLVANGSTWDNTAKWLHADGVVRPTSSDARHPTKAAAQAALDKYLGKENAGLYNETMSKLRKEQKNDMNERKPVPYDKLVVGREYRIEFRGDSVSINCYGNSVVTITKQDSNKFWCDHPDCRNGCPKYVYNFYETGAQAPEQETEMGQKLYTTALAVTSTDEETGAVTIKSVTDPETTDAVRLNQAMIARDRIQARKQGKDKPEVVGQLDDQTWKRMDDI